MEKVKIKSLRDMSNRERQETRQTVAKLVEFGYSSKEIAEMTGLELKQVYYIKEYFCGIAPPPEKELPPKERMKGEWAYTFAQEWNHMRAMFGKEIPA